MEINQGTKSAHVDAFNNYFTNSKAHFANWSQKKNELVHVVIGNEASDLDSIVCSTMYAYYLSTTEKKNAVAVVNIPREDFKLRTETTWLFANLGIKTENILFLPEVQSGIDALHTSKHLGLVLVDHNRLAASQEKYEDAVTEIIDHHAEEKRCQHATGERRVIEQVGSCGTLVARKILKQNPGLLDKALAKFLLAPVLLDTVNLDPKYKKVTKADEEITAELSKLIHTTEAERNQFFNALQDERFSVDSLNTYDLLRSDYKQWTMGKWEVGVSSAKRSIKSWQQKDPNLVKELDSYLKSRKLNILYAMTQFMEGNDMRRELIIYSPNKALYEESKKFLLASDLQLKEVDHQSTNDHAIGYFHQGNVAASRKQLQPLLTDHYEPKR